jgi:hypothetical protein
LHGVIILHGAHHIIGFQSTLMVHLFGSMVGLPIREAIASPDKTFAPLFKLLDDVYCAGIDYRVSVPGGEIWLIRLADCSGVGLYYERLRVLPDPVSLVEPTLFVPAAWATTLQSGPD